METACTDTRLRVLMRMRMRTAECMHMDSRLNAAFRDRQAI